MQLPRQVQTERLVIVVDVAGPAGSGKTAKLARIVNAIKVELDTLDDWDFVLTSTDRPVFLKRMRHRVDTDFATLHAKLEVHHNGA